MLAKINREDKIPLIAYPNSGEVFDKEQRLERNEFELREATEIIAFSYHRKWTVPEDYADFIEDIPQWVALGAKYVGGCCRNDASRIQKIRSFIDKRM